MASSFESGSVNRTTYICQFGSLALPHRSLEGSVINGMRYLSIRGKDPGVAGNHGPRCIHFSETWPVQSSPPGPSFGRTG